MSDPANSFGMPQSNIYGPLTVGRMFERTGALLREYPQLFLGIGLLMLGVELVVSGILGGSELWINRVTDETAPLAKAMLIVPLSLLGGALIYIFAQIVKGAVFYATQAKLTDRPMTVGEACRLAAERLGRLIGISILVALRILGFVLLLYVAFAVLAVILVLILGVFAHGMGNPSGFQFSRGHLAGMGIFLGLFIVLGIAYVAILFWLVLRYAVAIPAALEENLFAGDAIRRSIQLTRGDKGRLAALFAVVFGIYIAVVAMTMPMQLMMAHAARGHLGVLPPAFHLFAALISIFGSIVSSAMVVFAGVATTLCYYDLRVRKEGFGGAAVAVPTLPSAPLPPVLDGPIEDLPIS